VSQVFQNLTHPLTLAILLLALGLVLRKRRAWGPVLAAAALLLILIFGSPWTAHALVQSLEDRYPDRPVEEMPAAQAIVVLGGSLHIPNRFHREIGLVEPTDREHRAVRLYKAGKAPIVVATGGNQPVPGGITQVPESHVMSALMQQWGVPESAILVEDRSINTRENAAFTFAMLSARQIRRILLVTSAMHMPRAAATFRKAGFDVIAAPADFHTGWTRLDLPLNWWPSAHSLDQCDIAVKEWLGVLVYRIRGWI
jgi:uncharacterized SAM-binding protein YcdF (DUF218 family)